MEKIISDEIFNESQLVGPIDPSTKVDESPLDELYTDPLSVNSTEGMGKSSLYIVIICTGITLCIFAYQLIKLLIRVRQQQPTSDGYFREGKDK